MAAWTRSLKPVHLSTLTGDRVNLPSECLESITRDSNHSHPLTFQLIRALPSQQDQQPQQQQQKATVFASVREFTAPPGIIQIGPLLAEALGLANLTSLESPDAMTEEPIPDVDSYILVTIEQLPPGVHAKLTPLDSTYLEITDMRATLETHLRKHHATLTKGLTLHVTEISRTSRRAIEHRFLVSELHAADNDNPVPGCIILDQDVTVDIEPLDRSAAEEAVRNKYAIRATPECTLAWGSNDDRGQASTKGVVEPNQHVYFQLPAQPGVCEYTVQLEPLTGDADLFLSTILEHPTLLDHTHFNVESGLSTISLQIDHEVSPILYIGVLGSTDGEGALPSQFEICVRSSPSSSTSSSAPAMDAPDELTGETIQCENCKTSIRAATYQLHLAFCLRHNILCSQCHRAFPKSAIDAHWHCSFCDASGNGGSQTQRKHVRMFHTPQNCECGAQIYLSDMAEHRARICPARLHVCRFCHLLVPAGLPSFTAKDLMLGGMSSHESDCGARTIQCRKCSANIQLKDVQTHMAMHKHQTRLQPPPPPLCCNTCCATIQNPAHPNHARLCPACFAPFWNPRPDPQNQKYSQKLVALYFQQLTTGCGRPEICKSKHCASATGRSMEPTDAALAALALIKQPQQQHALCSLVTDARILKRRTLADALVPLGYSTEWCVKALVASDDNPDAAAHWLTDNAPPRTTTVS